MSTQTITNEYNDKTPPVTKGELINVRAMGKAKNDPYVKYHGYIIFIKKVPNSDDSTEHEMVIRIMAIKNTYAFAEFVKWVYE